MTFQTPVPYWLSLPIGELLTWWGLYEEAQRKA